MTRFVSLERMCPFLSGCVLAAAANAQPALPPGAAGSAGILRAVLASVSLPSVVDAPRYFRLARISLPARQTTEYNGAVGFVFCMSGSVEIANGSDRQLLNRGEGLTVPGGRITNLRAMGTEPASFLHFVLLKESELGQPMEGGSAAVTELHKTASPIPGLKPGPYEFTLVRVTFPPRQSFNPPHHRSGAALYHVLAGSGMMTLEGKTESRPAGVVQYEPSSLVHSWGNAGDAPLMLIQANISQEGVPAVIFDSVPGVKAGK